MSLKQFTLIEWLVLGSIVCILGALLIGGFQGTQHQQEMIAQCMHDGKKQYECEALIKPRETRVTVQHF